MFIYLLSNCQSGCLYRYVSSTKKEIILNYSNNCYLCIFKIVYIYGTEVNRCNATARSRRHNYASNCLCCISPLTTVGGPVDGQTSPEIPKENTMVFVYLNCSQKFKHHWQRIVFMPFQMLPIRDVRFRCSRLPSLFFICGPHLSYILCCCCFLNCFVTCKVCISIVGISCRLLYWFSSS